MADENPSSGGGWRSRLPSIRRRGTSSSGAGFRQTLREGWKPAHKRRGGLEQEGADAPTKALDATAAEKAAAKTGATTEEKTGTKPAAPTLGGRQPAPDLPGRIDGLRGWLEEIERKQGRMLYFGAAALTIALLASGVALYLGLTAQSDKATKDDVDKVRESVTALQGDVSQLGAGRKSLTQTISGLEAQVKGLQARQQQSEQQISALQKQAAQAPPVPSTPTPTPTTPGTGGSGGGNNNN